MFLSTNPSLTPWLLPLPRPNRRLSALAARVATCASPLIAVSGEHSLLGVTTDPDAMLRITWWNRQWAVHAELASPPSSFCPATSPEGALQRSGMAFLAYLSGRWPPEALPPSLGIVTDGVGVVFSPSHPSPRAEGWFQRHSAGAARPLAILPFAASGPGSLLAADPWSATVH